MLKLACHSLMLSPPDKFKKAAQSVNGGDIKLSNSASELRVWYDKAEFAIRPEPDNTFFA